MSCGDGPATNSRKRKPGGKDGNNSNAYHQKRQRKSGEFLKRMGSMVANLLSRGINDPPSHKDYMNLYSDVYENLVEASIRIKSCSRSENANEFSGFGCNAEQIYSKLDAILKKKMREIIQSGIELDRSKILQFYADEFTLYKLHANFLHGIFSYMNRAWVKSVNQSPLGPCETMYSFTISQWRNAVFREFNNQVVDALFAQIQEYRCNQSLNEDLIKTVIESYVILSDPTNGPGTNISAVKDLSLYTANFEESFLNRSKKYFENIALDWISTKKTEAYLADVSEFVNKEKRLAEILLHASTVPKLEAVILDEFIRAKSELLVSALPTLLEEDDYKSLTLFFQLLTNLNNFSMDPIIGVFKKVMTDFGLKAAEVFHNATIAKEIEGKQIPTRYVDELVTVCRKFDLIITKCFNNSVNFRKVFDEAAVQFVNQNAHTKIATDEYNFNKTPELLGRYSNSILMSSNSAQEEFSEALDKMFMVLKFIESKDSFERYYNWNLLKRLVNNTSSNDDNETVVITQMKTTFGQDYSMKSFQLIRDARLSEDISQSFKNALKEKQKSLPWDFYICIFKNGSCKLPESVPFNLPPELTLAMNHFTEFYGQKYEGRILTWYHNKSHGEIVYYAGLGMKKYTFVASVYQMAILLLFNEKFVLTFDEIAESTRIDISVLKQVLPVLERTKLLVQNSSKVYEVYEGYKSSKGKHDINVPLKVDAKTGSQEAIVDEVRNQRKFVLQAVMVRLMKANQTMRHSDLIVETISAVSGRFKPNIVQIKRTIDCLLEKEYFKRDEKKTDQYVYIS